MSLSSIAAQQREKEAKKLNSLLAFGLIGSLALHVGVLSLSIENLTEKVAVVKDKQLEIEIVELPIAQKPELEQSPQAKESLVVNNSDINRADSENGSIALSSGAAPTRIFKQPLRSPKSRTAISPSKPAIATKQPPVATPAKKVERLKTQLVTPIARTTANPHSALAAKLRASTNIANPKPIVTPPPLVSASPTVPSSISQQPSDRQIRNLLANTRNTQQKPNNISASKPSGISDRQAKVDNYARDRSGNSNGSTASGSRIATGSNPGTSLSNTTTGSRVGTGNNFGGGANNGTDNGSRIGTSRGTGSNIATGTQNSSPSNTRSESNGNPNSNSGGLACRSCSKPKYPDKARRRGLEGKAEISVDVDGKGNVTDVRLARSSGHSELDKAALEEARRWKFKAPNGGARGVSAKVDFAIEGSERSRKLRERRKRRQTEQRRTPTTEAADAPTSMRRISNSTSRQNASSPRQTATSRRRVDTLPPGRVSDPPQRPRAAAQRNSQTRLRQSLRRQQPPSNRATPASQSKLRQSLRQLRNSQPVATPND